MVCGGAVEHGTLFARNGRVQRCAHCIICTNEFLFEVIAGRVLVYGGCDAFGQNLATVEMLSTDGPTLGYWATLPTPMFHAEVGFASVALP